MICKVTAILFPKKGQPAPDNGYAIVLAEPEDKSVRTNGRNISVKGPMPGVHVNARIDVYGEWRNDKYGRAFCVKYYKELLPSSLLGIKNYLSSGLIKGIGPVIADEIVREFGEKALEIIDNDPDKLLEVNGIGKKKAEKIIESWKEQRSIQDIMVFLKTFNVTNGLAAKIFKKFGKESVSVLKTHPYRLADEIEGVGFFTADKVALSMNLPCDSDERIHSAILYVLKENCEKCGHTFCLKDDLAEQTTQLLNKSTASPIQKEKVIGCIESMEKDLRFEGEDNEKVYLPLFFNAERAVAKRLGILNRAKTKLFEDDIDFDKLEKDCKVTFEQEQKDAIATAMKKNICVITGGPGTGKTTTMRGLIYAACQNKLDIRLAAPTGRAAKRLSETTGMDASTIHRLLEYRPGDGFAKNDKNPLYTDLIVIDESSMIDIVMMSSLLKAVRSETKVVFVGDIDQLPSIGAGNVLRDMIESDELPVVKLTKVFRQAQQSLIVRNAHAINQGKTPEMPTSLMKESEDFCFIERDEAEKIQKDILTLIPKYIPETFSINPSDIQVLSPRRTGPLGTETLNQLLQNALNPSNEKLVRGNIEFRKGDRVMQMKNNYDLDIFNGDMGVVKDVDTKDRILTVDFDGNVVDIEGTSLDELDLAYCSTIHKSQGSEYPVAVIVASMSHYMMLTKNLLYTAITRAKKRCIVIGDKRAIMTMVNDNSVHKRNSMLKERIIENS